MKKSINCWRRCKHYDVRPNIREEAYMRFSLFHLPSFFPQFHSSEAQFYQDMLQETDRAEAYGFHSVWFAEHHFHNYGGHIPSVPVLGAAVAQRTQKLRIASGISLLPLQD